MEKKEGSDYYFNNVEVNMAGSPSDKTAEALAALAKASIEHAKAITAIAEALKPVTSQGTGIMINSPKGK